MELNDLKSMWHDVHNLKKEITFGKISIENSLTMSHCRAITKILSDIKLKIAVYTLVVIVYFGLMYYALIYLNLKLTLISLISLALVGAFLLINTVSEIGRLIILSKSADNLPVKESLLLFRKRLNRIRVVDFLMNILFLYSLAIIMIVTYISDIGGIGNLSWRNEYISVPILATLTLLIFLIPWFIKYLHTRRYKNLYLSLKDAASQLEDRSSSI